MRRSVRRSALGLLVVVFLLANGYSGVVAYTLLAGPRVVAEVTSCSTSSKGSTSCSGRWTGPDGEAGSGGIEGAFTSDLHRHIPVRIGPLGAFTDNLHAHLWVRSIFAVAVDAALVTIGALLWRIRRRGPEAVARLKAEDPSARYFTIGNNTIGLLDGERLFTVEDVGRAQMRFRDTSGAERWRLRGEDHHAGIRTLVLTDPSGNVSGYVRKAYSTVTLLDASENHLATAVYKRIHGVPGYRFVSPTGQQLGTAVSARGAMVARIHRDAPDVLPLLVFGYVQGSGWLSRPSVARKAPRPSASDRPALRPPPSGTS